MHSLRALIIFVFSFAVLLTGCSSEKKLAGHMEKAEAYIAAGEYDKAEIELKNAVRLDTEGSAAAALLGQIYFEQGRLAQAAPILFAVAKQAPDNLDNRINLAAAYLSTGRPDDAHLEARTILERRPDDPMAPLVLAESARDTESISETRAFLEDTERTSGPTPAIQVGLAVLAFREKNLDAAAGHISKALELDPNYAAAYAAQGSLQLAQGETEACKASLAKAAALSPARSFRGIQYARFLQQGGETDAARAFLEQLLSSAPNYLPALILVAEIAFAEKDAEEASEYLDKALSRDPTYPEALQLKGRLALIQKKPEEAIEIFERMLSLYPGNARVHYLLALAYLAEEQREKAITNLKRTVSLKPDFSEAILLLAQMEIQTGAATDAVLALRILIEKQPELTQARVLLAEAYQTQGDLDGALRVYRDLTEQHPDSPQGHLAQGLILMQQGDRDAARSAFENALGITPDYMPAAEQLLNLDLAERNPPAAETRARILVDTYPDRQGSHFLLARALVAGGKMAEAETTMQRAIAIDPSVRTPQIYLVNLYIQNKKPTEALELLSTVIEQHPEDLEALALRGMIQLQQEAIADAIETYERILEIEPDSGIALNNLAYFYSENGEHPERSFELAQRARKLAPNDPYSADTLGWIVFKRGDYPWAVSLLQESADRLPNEPEVLYHLGLAQYFSGKTNHAEVAFTRALELSDSFKGAEDARLRLKVLSIAPETAAPDARQTLEKSIERIPGDPVALTKLGRLLELEGAHKEAIVAYEQALDVQPEFTLAMVGLARLQKDTGRGLEMAKEAYKLDSDNAAVAATVGRLAFEQGEFSWAVSVLQNAARKEPGNTELAYDLARALYAVGRLAEVSDPLAIVLKAGDSFSRSDEAQTFSNLVALVDSPAEAALQVRMIQGVLASDPKSVPALMAHGMALEQQRKTDVAEEEYRKALEIYPDFTPAIRRRALIMALDPVDLDAAYKLASEAREMFPEDPAVAGALGKLAYLKNDYRRALTLLSEATRANEASAENWFYLGMTQVKSGDTPGGKASLERAIAMGLANELQREAESALRDGASGS